MILTCPACATKYVVKDDAVPPGGRQVRCASCKHSWHVDPEPAADEESQAVRPSQAAAPIPSEPLADTDQDYVPVVAPSGDVVAEIAGPEEGLAESETPEAADPEWGPADVQSSAMGDYADGGSPAEAPQPGASEDDFQIYAPIRDESEPGRRRWPLLLGLLILIAAAAAAFWLFASPEWKARAGIAKASATPLQLMITTRDRQMLESGNELIAISGRVINPTDSPQDVPPIMAELRDARTKAIVHRWTIAPPSRVLAPRASASFNSAEVDVPKGGDELTISLGS
ncbi:zinc-ribbon domain-containing protein [Sphingomonas xanthus]|nr:zinc-ribbon domain-containing protein [Sphingomonas xanthus]